MDKRALLGELKIDRGAPAAETSQRPWRWFVVIACVAGIAFIVWFVNVPKADPVPVAPVVAAAPVAKSAPEGSVLDATGYVVARRKATVSAKVTGKVVDVLIEEGMRVEAGQVLARLDASIPRAELALAESQLASARAGLEELNVQIRQAELDLHRTEGLAARKLASAADLDRAQLTLQGLQARLDRQRSDVVVAQRGASVQRQLLDDMEIRAPFTGIVVDKAAQPGEMISPNSAGGGFTRTGICTIVDMDSLEVEVDVNEAYINRVQPKQPVSVALNAYPDDRIPAEVIAIIPTADRNKATVRVRIGLLEKSPKVLPDMGVKVAFLDEKTAKS
jgi:RND family efflux transporter MFP subunit